MSNRMLSRMFLGALVAAVVLLVIACGGGAPAAPGTAPSPATPSGNKEIKQWAAPPEMTIDITRKYGVYIQTFTPGTTNTVTIIAELFAPDAPKTVNNFVFLARQGFYSGVTWHRVIPGFMAQTGDPTGTGAGGPGYTFEDEINDHKVVRGALAMANAGADTNGSQFFIPYADQPSLDGKHTVFGQVISGMEILDGLTPRDPNQNPQFIGDRIQRILVVDEGVYPDAGAPGS